MPLHVCSSCMRCSELWLLRQRQFLLSTAPPTDCLSSAACSSSHTPLAVAQLCAQYLVTRTWLHLTATPSTIASKPVLNLACCISCSSKPTIWLRSQDWTPTATELPQDPGWRPCRLLNCPHKAFQQTKRIGRY